MPYSPPAYNALNFPAGGAYTPPAYNALDFGNAGAPVAVGFKATTFGTPTVSLRHVAAGSNESAFGTPTVVASAVATGFKATTFGTAEVVSLAIQMHAVASLSATLRTGISLSALLRSSASLVADFAAPQLPAADYSAPPLERITVLNDGYVDPEFGAIITLSYPSAGRVLVAHTSGYAMGYGVTYPVKGAHVSPYAATVQRQHTSASYPSLRRAHTSGYSGTVEVSASHTSDYVVRFGVDVKEAHTASYGLRIATTHTSRYSVPVRAVVAHRELYGSAVRISVQHASRYTEVTRVRRQHSAAYVALLRVQATQHERYSDASSVHAQHYSMYTAPTRVRKAHTGSYAALYPISAAHAALYYTTQPISVQHNTAYGLSSTNRVQAASTAFWSMTSDGAVIVADETYLDVGGRRIRIEDGVLTADRDTPYWSLSFRVHKVEDYMLLTDGADVVYTVGGEAFSLRIDGRSIDRDSMASVDLRATAKSPVYFLGSPRMRSTSFSIDTAITAHAAVELFLGQTVTWETVDWALPPLKLVFDSVTPLDAASTVVEAVGATIQSKPDGTLVVRSLFPVSTSVLQQATPNLILSDDIDMLTAAGEYVYSEGANLVRVSEGETSYQDRLDWVTDEGTELLGTLSLYPSPWRAGVTVEPNQASPTSTCTEVGDVLTTHTEVVEFTNGQASTRYPVMSVDGVVWLSAPLGAVAFSAYSTTINCGVGVNDGYGLAEVTYTAKSRDYRVSGTTNTQVQFIARNT